MGRARVFITGQQLISTRIMLIDARSLCLYTKGLFGMFTDWYTPTGNKQGIFRLPRLSRPHQAAYYFFLNISDYMKFDIFYLRELILTFFKNCDIYDMVPLKVPSYTKKTCFKKILQPLWKKGGSLIPFFVFLKTGFFKKIYPSEIFQLVFL